MNIRYFVLLCLVSFGVKGQDLHVFFEGTNRQKSKPRQHDSCAGGKTAPASPQDQMQGGLLLNIVVLKSQIVIELFPSKDQTLLVSRYSLNVCNFVLHK